MANETRSEREARLAATEADLQRQEDARRVQERAEIQNDPRRTPDAERHTEAARLAEQRRVQEDARLGPEAAARLAAARASVQNPSAPQTTQDAQRTQAQRDRGLTDQRQSVNDDRHPAAAGPHGAQLHGQPGHTNLQGQPGYPNQPGQPDSPSGEYQGGQYPNVPGQPGFVPGQPGFENQPSRSGYPGHLDPAGPHVDEEAHRLSAAHAAAIGTTAPSGQVPTSQNPNQFFDPRLGSSNDPNLPPNPNLPLDLRPVPNPGVTSPPSQAQQIEALHAHVKTLNERIAKLSESVTLHKNKLTEVTAELATSNKATGAQHLDAVVSWISVMRAELNKVSPGSRW